MDKGMRIKELVELLNRAVKAYEQEDREIMSNFEYDRLYDELKALEEETGMILSNSPTVRAGYEVLSNLPKVEHAEPMLSLDKTKEVSALREWLNDKEGLLSWKLDGLTVVLTYENGKLVKAVTRGNGTVGELITANAKTFKNIPLSVSSKESFTIRGEAVIKYSDFEKINASIEDVSLKYKNPRNLCSGAVRQLNSAVTAERNVNFYAFSYITEHEKFKYRHEQLEFLKEQGFETVDYLHVNSDNIDKAIAEFADRIKDFDIPSDGLVLTYDDIAYGVSLGRTAKFPRHSIAFKWADELAETRLLEIEWSASRTGLINPVAIFEPVELEGTTVSRASLHNLSIMEELQIGIGDTIKVYKANMIIPQIAENLTRSGNLDIPVQCPVCGGETEVRNDNDTKVLMCKNPECQAKKIKAFAHFVSRDAMNIDGLSEATLEKFIAKGFLHSLTDLFALDRYRQEIVEMEGMGEKSYTNLIEAVEKSKNCTLPALVYSLGILNIGLANAKLLCREFAYDADAIMDADKDTLMNIQGFGEVIADTFTAYFSKEENRTLFKELLSILNIEKPEIVENASAIQGKTFVITGSLNSFENRNALKDFIEARGGKVTGSVTSKTDYLINNDNLSGSTKNKTAAKLGIPVITEEEFMQIAERN